MKDMKKDAKKKSICELRDMMKEMMGEKHGESLKDKMAVKVVADSPEGLEEGLSKAEQILKKRKEMMSMDDDYDSDEASKDYESKEDMRKKIAMLEAKLKDMA
jgi:hypothetical protein